MIPAEWIDTYKSRFLSNIERMDDIIEQINTNLPMWQDGEHKSMYKQKVVYSWNKRDS